MDEGGASLSDADAAALEIALRFGDAWRVPVTAVTLGPAAAESTLREAVACGAARAVRVDAAEPLGSAGVAAALAAVVSGFDVVCCGDQGTEAGTGAVPAFLAAELRVAAALGLLDVTVPASPSDRITAVRRLDGGRREHVATMTPAVLSLVGAAARLRRAGLPGVLRAAKGAVDVVAARCQAGAMAPLHVGQPRPYRPRPRVVPAPAGDTALDRVRALTGAGSAPATGRRAPIVADPEEAADLILRELAAWGYGPATGPDRDTG